MSGPRRKRGAFGPPQVRRDCAAGDRHDFPCSRFDGWFKRPDGQLPATDVLSGLASCPAAKSYSGRTTRRLGRRDLPRQRRKRRHPVPDPQVRHHSAAGDGDADAPANANGWYNAPLSVGFAGTDATAGLASCEAQKT